MASQGPENSYATLYALIFPNSRVVRKNQKSLVGLIYPVRTVERMDARTEPTWTYLRRVLTG
jgi:hypothetical protein